MVEGFMLCCANCLSWSSGQSEMMINCKPFCLDCHIHIEQCTFFKKKLSIICVVTQMRHLEISVVISLTVKCHYIANCRGMAMPRWLLSANIVLMPAVIRSHLMLISSNSVVQFHFLCSFYWGSLAISGFSGIFSGVIICFVLLFINFDVVQPVVYLSYNVSAVFCCCCCEGGVTPHQLSTYCICRNYMFSLTIAEFGIEV